MANSIISIPNTWGGVSRQAPALRHPNQFEEGDNVLFDIVDGAQKRPGSNHIAFLDGLTDGLQYKIHTIDRDDQEQYIVVIGHGVLRIFDTSGVEQSVAIDSSAETYLTRNDLDGAAIGRDDLVLLTVSDTTFILNRKVSPRLTASEHFAVTDTHQDYDDLVSNIPAVGTYHRTKFSSSGHPAGFYRYFPFFQVGDGGAVNHAVVDITPGDATEKRKIRIKPAIDLSATYGSLHDTKIRLVGIEAAGSDIYNIHAIVDGDATNDAVSVTPTPGSSDATAAYELRKPTWAEWIGPQVGDTKSRPSFYSDSKRNPWAMRISFYDPKAEETTTVDFKDDFSYRSFADMDAVADAFTVTMHAQLPHTRVTWLDNGKDKNDKRSGRFKITSPFPGYGSTITGPSTAVGVIGFDHTTGSGSKKKPFSGSDDGSQMTEGTGDLTDMLPDDNARWIPVAAPGQVDAIPDQTTLPVQMERIVASDVVDGEYSPSAFRVSLQTWNSRISGDSTSNPNPRIFQATGESDNPKFLADMALIHNRLVLAADNIIVMSQAGDINNLWLEDTTIVVDSDPIDVEITDAVDHIVAFRNTLVVFGRGGRQYEIGSRGAMTPERVTVAPTTANDSMDLVRPATMRHQIYFVGQRKTSTQVYEYYHDDESETQIAFDISAHVFGYVPTDISSMVASANNNTLFIHQRDDDKLYVYKTYFSDRDRAQAAWSTYHLLDGARVE